MDSSLREWLVIIGMIIIVAVAIDGWRRVRRARLDSREIAAGMGGEVSGTPLDEDYNPELPNGGYRVIRPGSESEGEDRLAPLESRPQRKQKTAEDEVPEGMTGLHAGRDDFDLSDGASGLKASERATVTGSGQATRASGPHDAEPVVSETRTRETTRHDGDSGLAPVEAEQFIMIHLVSREREGFRGTAIQSIAEACGMTLNPQGLYVRHELDTGVGPVQFSMANASESGRFDELDLESTRIRGLIFFVGLPGPQDPMRAFDYMLEMARYLADKLDGELRDEHQSVMTQQTVDYCRQRIQEFLRRERLAGQGRKR